MKVLHLSSEKSWRGGEQQMAYLIEELGKLGVDSRVAARKDSAFEKWCGGKNIPCFTLGFKNDFDLASAFRLKQECTQENFDLLHLHSSRSHGIAFLSAILGNGTPMILSRRVDFALKKNIFSQWKYNHTGIKKIICVSEKIREIVSSSVKHPQRCVTVYDGIDLHRFAGKGIRGTLRKELKLDANTLLIGNIAALAPHKDYFTFLDTVKILTGKIKAKYLIAGDGPLRDSIEQRIRELNLQEEVFMLGFRQDLENVFADLDILLYTSREEGLGSTLLDAMAYGLPVVSTEAGGIPEIVLNGLTGLTAPVANSEALSSQVIRISNDSLLREQLVTKAREFVKDFSKEKMALRTLEVYREVAAH